MIYKMKTTKSSCTLPLKFYNWVQSFKNILRLFVGEISCFVFLIFVVLSIPVYLFRYLVILLAKVLRPDLDEILNGLSACLANDYFYNSKSPRANVIVSLVLQDRDMSIDELKSMLLERWIHGKDPKTGKQTFKQFAQYPVRWMGFTFYKNCMETFNINNHVYLQKLPNHKNFVNDEDVNNICESLLNTPYKPCSSPWEVHLVKNYQSESLSKRDSDFRPRYIVIFKVHHCLADGFSLLNALVEGFGQNSLSNVELPMARSPKRNFWEKIIFNVCFPIRAFCEFSYVLSHTFKFSPWKISDGKKEWYQVCTKSDYIPIEKVKFIKTKLGVSFTSVLMSAISSGVYQSLKDSKRKIRKKMCKNGDDNSMFAMCALPLPGHSKELTNHATAALFDLPVGRFNHCVERLHNVNAMLETSKSTCTPVVVPLYFSAMGCHFYPVAKHLGMQRMSPMGLTNFPSPPIKIVDSGRLCISTDFMTGGMDGEAGVGIMVLSYSEYIRIAVTAEKAVLSKSDVRMFVEYVMNEIDSLYIEACELNGVSKVHADSALQKTSSFLFVLISLIFFVSFQSL